MRQWSCPEPGGVQDIASDFRVGGSYTIAMRVDGKDHTAIGTYQEIDAPNRLVYTWDWKEEDNHMGETLVTGEVDRTTEYEQGFPIHQALRGEEWAPDPLILDDQALIANVRGKGLVVLTGCGHAGIVNTVRYVKKLTGVDEVCAIIGGFHLGGTLFEAVVPPTVAALQEIAPSHILPAHCTGWPAQVALSAAMPEAFVTPAVGTRLDLTA